jgi:large subunit ribosomal protein L22
MAQVTAQLNNLRISPRKVRAVGNLVKGKNVNEALSQLDYYVRKPANPIKKLLNSAIANAENNFSMVKDNLFVKNIIVNEGVKLKRFKAKGFGRAAAIQKKTSHILITLEEYKQGLKKERSARSKKEVVSEAKEETKTFEGKKPEVKREIGKKGVLGNIGKKLFQRKAV